MKGIDFFCGGGGLTRGLNDAGIEIIAGVDIDNRCQNTYEHNNPQSSFINANIKDIGTKVIRSLKRGGNFSDFLFAGCAPCQPFSTQHKGMGSQHLATLLSEFGRLVEEFLPGFVFIENVPGIARVKGYSTFLRFLNMLLHNHYVYCYDVIDAKFYGVPQNRRRLVLLASRLKQPAIPKYKFGTELRPFKTVRQAIAHYPAITSGESHPDVPNHVASLLSKINIERLQATPHDGGDRRAWPSHLRLNCHSGNYNGHTDVYGRMYWDKPSPALTGRCNSVSNGRYGHPEQDRAITLREAAALQTFPDGYIFHGSVTHVAKQIGNAVPVRLAETIGKSILNLRNN